MVDGSTACDRESQVLLVVARPRLTSDQHEYLRTLTRAPFDWNRLVASSEAHGLWPLVHMHLTAAGVSMPPELAQGLQQRVMEATAFNLSALAQLAGVLTQLTTQGIPAVGLKGPLIAAQAYGHLGVRPFGDLDVLIPRDYGRRARTVLHALGYKDADQYSIVDGVYPDAGREYVFVPSGWTGLTLEVKVDVSDWSLPVALSADQLIERGTEVSVAGVTLPTLSPEDNLLALVVHGVRHGWTGLRYVSDVHAAATLALDWPALQARAESARMTRMLHIALLLSHGMLQTPLPAGVLAGAARDRAARRVARDVDARMFRPMTPRQWRLWRTGITMRSREHLADRCRFAMRTIAFEQVVRPLDEWRSTRENAAAWRSAKIARRLALPLLLLAFYVASLTSRPLLVGTTLVAALTAIFVAIHVWASRREPVRAWSNRHA